MEANGTGAAWLSLVTVSLVLAGTQLTTCEAPARDFAPAMAFGQDRYTVAWVRPGRKGGAFEVQQFAKQSLKPLTPPTTIARRDDLVAGAVELVAVGDGYLAIGRVEDPQKQPNWATHILTVPLDARGQAVGKQHTFPWDRACRGAAVVEPYVLIAYKEVARSHRHPYDELGVLAVDRDGNYRGAWSVAANPVNCASAVHGGELAVVWTQWQDGEPGRPGVGLYVAFEEPRRDGRHETFAVPVDNLAASVARIAPLGDDWAILYAERDDHLHVAVIDSHGKLLRREKLPDAIDNETVDLASNERGLFVTWIDGGRVRFVGIDGRARTKTSGSGASRTRALGADSHCVAAWTLHAKRARVTALDSCP